MYDKSSPLEHLAATAIAFAAGVLATVGLSAYVKHVEHRPPTSSKQSQEDGAGTGGAEEQ